MSAELSPEEQEAADYWGKMSQRLRTCVLHGNPAFFDFNHAGEITIETQDCHCWDSGENLETLIARWNDQPHIDALQARIAKLHEAASPALDWIDEIYPPDVFDGSSGDEGPVRIAAIRENLRKALQEELPK